MLTASFWSLRQKKQKTSKKIKFSSNTSENEIFTEQRSTYSDWSTDTDRAWKQEFDHCTVTKIPSEAQAHASHLILNASYHK